MEKRVQFNKDEVLQVLIEAGKACPCRMSAYLVGGGAMAFRGEKDATKDVDLILEAPEHADELGGALQALGFEINIQPPMECRSLSDAKIPTVSRGMRVDIFVKKVCGKLVFSEGMKSRSERYGDVGNLSLSICSREDIFLLKSVTERSRDLDDMVVLYRKGIDKVTLLGECQLQGKYDAILGGRIWETFLLQKIEEMEDAYSISVPWKGELRRIARQKLETRLVIDCIVRNVNTVQSLAKELNMAEPAIRLIVRRLENGGLVFVDREMRPNTITINRACDEYGTVMVEQPLSQ